MTLCYLDIVEELRLFIVGDDRDPGDTHSYTIQIIEMQGYFREAAKKVLFLVVRPLRRGGGKGPTTKEKRIFFYIIIYFSPKFL